MGDVFRKSVLWAALTVAATMGLGLQAAVAQCVDDGRGTYILPCDPTKSITVNGGQVSFAGASLFVDFFLSPSSTNDWIDADGDGFAGYDPLTFPFVDQLASNWAPCQNLTTWWLFQYRSVGSVNGFNQFVDNQTCQVIPTAIPSERGIFNGFSYANLGAAQWVGPFANPSGTPLEPCEIEGAFLDVPGSWATQVPGTPAWDAAPTGDGYGLNPIPSSNGFISNLQTLTRTCGTCSGTGDACVSDTQCPAGRCSVSTSIACRSDANCPSGETCTNPVPETCVLAGSPVSLNTDQDNPDENTIFDFVAAWVPVAIISNRGTGIENIRFSESQYLFATGRLPSGENLVAATRDVGSGTRNAAMNSIGVDPSWARGENIGQEFSDATWTNLGSTHQASNCGGSGLMEDVVRYNRLGIGYTGLAGSSRAVGDAVAGRYEILNTCKDVDGDGDGNPDCDCSGFVRPDLNTVLDNCDPCTGYQIAGSGSFAVRGNPNANRDPADPYYEDSQALDNQAVAGYMNNIFDSIRAFTGSVLPGECNETKVCSGTTTVCTSDADCTPPATCVYKPCSSDSQCTIPGDFCKSKLNMPGQWLALNFFLPEGEDCLHEFTAPMDYYATAVNQTLQDFIRANYQGAATPVFGSVNKAGQVPKRNAVPAPGYSDGSTTGSYVYWTGAIFTTISSGNKLAERNKIQGDFDGDVERTVDDAASLVTAYYTPRTWQQSAEATGTGNVGNQTRDNAIPEVIGDFDGNGSLTKEDLRYFADGLAMSTARGELDRKAGHIAIDDAITAAGQPSPWADPRADLVVPSAGPPWVNPTFLTPTPDVDDATTPFLKTGKTYAAGDFRGDVAGRTPVAGAKPQGWDGVVDNKDVDYVCRNIGDWSDLNQAVYMDLSCDMDGDANVTYADVEELVVVILGTQIGDVDLDGDVDADDDNIILASITTSNPCIADQSCGWSDGDMNCDGIVDSTDLGCTVPAAPLAETTVPDTGNNGTRVRYLAFEADPSFAGQSLALRVTIADLPATFEYAEGRTAWVGEPLEVSEVAGLADDTPPTFNLAALGCEPFYADWTQYGKVYVYGESIVPSGIYEVQAVVEGCVAAGESAYSAPRSVRLSKWGDAVGASYAASPQGTVDFTDISSVVDKFKNLPGAPKKSRVDVSPNLPNKIVDFGDIPAVVDAFRGLAYPYAGPPAVDPCP